MKILFVGVFKEPWSTHHPIVKEFKRKNHEVIKFDFRQLSLKNMRITFPFYRNFLKEKFEKFIRYRPYLPEKIRNLKFYLFGNWLMNRQLLYLIKKNSFDLVFLAKCDTINYNLIKKFNKYTKTWFYFMDPLYISYEMRAYKYAQESSWSSASTMVNNLWFKKNGANSYYITQGVNLAVFNNRERKPNHEIDVIFAGTNTIKRKNYIEYLLKNNINIRCYGEGWDNGPIYLEKLAKEYKNSKIILNFHKEDSGFSIRIFQALATQSFVLSEYCSDLERIFKKGVHLDWFKTPEECVVLIKKYLDNQESREKIAQEGYIFVSKYYSWKNIIEKIMQIVEVPKNKI